MEGGTGTSIDGYVVPWLTVAGKGAGHICTCLTTPTIVFLTFINI